VGNSGVVVSLTCNYGRVRFTPGRIYGVPRWRSLRQSRVKKWPWC